IVDLREALADILDVLIAVPSIGFRETLTQLKPLIHPSVRISSATKGLDAQTGQLPHEIVTEILSNDYAFAALSGPTFAREVAAGLPTSAVIASHHPHFVSDLIARFDCPAFRVYASNDVIGVEVGGIVKNVIAIATGLLDGMELGTNARSTLITHG